MGIVVRGTWTQQRKLRTLAQRSKDPREVRRVLAIVWLMRGQSVTSVAGALMAARSSVYRWAQWFSIEGAKALSRTRGGRPAYTVTASLIEALEALLDETPRTFGYLRTTWSSELLSVALNEHHGLVIHPSTVRRAMQRTEFRWRRARPTLCKRDPRKAEKLQAIGEAIDTADAYTEVFFVDEADIDLNPRFGFTWSRRGHQSAIPTPGQNEKHYVGGALHARTGRLVWVEHPRKNSMLFLKLLNAVRGQYRRARRIVLILDNYIIHKSEPVQRWLANNPKFELLFQPVYYPWINQIERLWKAMHDTVTRNHRCTSLYELCQDVKRFFQVVQPFPGANHGVAENRSAI